MAIKTPSFPDLFVLFIGRRKSTFVTGPSAFGTKDLSLGTQEHIPTQTPHPTPISWVQWCTFTEVTHLLLSHPGMNGGATTVTIRLKRSITHFWNQRQSNPAGWSRKQFTWPSTRGSVPAFPVVLTVGCWFAFSPERTISPSHLRFILQTGGHWLEMTGQAASKPKEDGLTSPEVKLGSLRYSER